MFALVYNSNVAGQAVAIIAQQAEKHSSRGLAHAAGVIAQAFNSVSNRLVMLKGWTPEELGECDRAIQVAFRTKIQLVSEGPIVLQ